MRIGLLASKINKPEHSALFTLFLKPAHLHMRQKPDVAGTHIVSRQTFPSMSNVSELDCLPLQTAMISRLPSSQAPQNKKQSAPNQPTNQPDRRTDGRTARQTDVQTGRQAGKQAGRQTHRHTENKTKTETETKKKRGLKELLRSPGLVVRRASSSSEKSGWPNFWEISSRISANCLRTALDHPNDGTSPGKANVSKPRKDVAFLETFLEFAF